MIIVERKFLFYAYTCLLLLPVLYRLTLPQVFGNYLFYIIAFLVPVVGLAFEFIFSRSKLKILSTLLFVFIIISLSWLLASKGELNLLLFFYGFKIYVLPIMIFLFGYHLSLSVGRSGFIKFLLVIVSLHFLFSLLFYYDILYNPMYDTMSDRYAQNWVSTVGDFKAFMGLTLSKFGLAYQVGFIILGLLLVRKYDKENRLAFSLTFLLGLILIVFTYNKTIMVLLLFAMLYLVYQVSQNKSKALAFSFTIVVVPVLLYGLTMFMQGQLSMTDIYRFLSPQTFWSRIIHWQASLHYDTSCIWSGYGAGYLYHNDLIMDSQYLSSYLELGILGTVTYFSLLVYVLYNYSLRDLSAKIFIGLYLLVFVGGDMLGSVEMIYVIGIMMAQSMHSKPSVKIENNLNRIVR